VGISAGAVVEYQRKQPGAPTDAEMISWGTKRGCRFVGRYYPRRKGWMVLFIADAIGIPRGHYTKWIKYGRGTKVYATEDAMVMHVMAACGVTP
jgi:hypothetical protein